VFLAGMKENTRIDELLRQSKFLFLSWGTVI
jgi:hypothetical protein